MLPDWNIDMEHIGSFTFLFKFSLLRPIANELFFSDRVSDSRKRNKSLVLSNQTKTRIRIDHLGCIWSKIYFLLFLLLNTSLKGIRAHLKTQLSGQITLNLKLQFSYRKTHTHTRTHTHTHTLTQIATSQRFESLRFTKPHKTFYPLKRIIYIHLLQIFNYL